MTNRERLKAVWNYEPVDQFPLVHFGYWKDTLVKWANEGHISMDDAVNWRDATDVCRRISPKLRFDFAYWNAFPWYDMLYPAFEIKVMKERPDGSKEVMDSDGVIIVQKEGVVCIPAAVGHSLKDRKSWEELYKPKLQFSEEAVAMTKVKTDKGLMRFDSGGLEYLKDESRENHVALMVGSLIGKLRDWLGVEGLSYMMVDDEKLLDEIIETVAELCYAQAEYVLATGAKFDFAHYWEDICFRNGPLISPKWFYNKIGPHYKRIGKLIASNDINITSVDCDGVIDSLIPGWLDNGVNTMFPIEVGTWGGSFGPWREKYGKEIRGVGGMNKNLFACDYKTIDAEIERLKPLVEMGGYIPCPDHQIPPEAIWENVQYYCDKTRETFS